MLETIKIKLGVILMKKMSKLSILALAGALFVGIGFTAPTQAKADAVTASDMAKGISIALVCTFTGLMVAVPLLTLAYILKAKLTHTMHEINNDVGEMIRAVSGGGQAQ